MDVRLLNSNKITESGRYVDFENNLLFTLKDEDILKAREYFNNPELAYERKIEKQNTKKVYVNTRESKYNRFKTKKRITNIGKKVVVAGTVVVLSYSLYNYINSLHEISTYDKSSYIAKIKSDSFSENNDDMYKVYDAEIANKSEDVKEINKKRKKIIKKYCEIYGINYEVAYKKLKELTRNFSDKEYLNDLTISCITCKGENIYASNEEELLLYAIRFFKQSPDKVGMDISVLCEDNDYVSSTDYSKQIEYYANLLGVDKYLVYAIVQSETGFDSDLFKNKNNPAGLKMNEAWWSFYSKEEGFIELCLEILKYNRRGAYTIEEIGAIHAPLSDGNENWIPNVEQNVNWARENSDKLFDNLEENNDLSIGR